MNTSLNAVLYHNPRCSKSRETLSLLKEQGIAPKIVLYLDTPPSMDALNDLIKMLGFQSARELMRTKEEEYKTLGLSNPSLTEIQLRQAMIDHPKLIERPIFIYRDRAVLGRPPEAVLALL